MKTIYVAGKITDEIYSECFEKFKQKEKELTERGYTVINPMKEERGLRLKNFKEKISWGDVMVYLLDIINKKVDVVYMLKDWEQSTGAKIEANFAQRCGKEVIYEQDD